MGKLRQILSNTCVAALIGLMAGCGGGGGGGSGTTSTVEASPQAVEGVATPNNVSVVTANNAGS